MKEKAMKEKAMSFQTLRPKYAEINTDHKTMFSTGVSYVLRV
jgi:hypothetical protein